MSDTTKIALGLDFGTESVRALLVDLDGREQASAVSAYQHGQITDTLPGTGEKLPPNFAFQHPQDWIDSSAEAVQEALKTAGLTGDEIIGIGVDFTSCTMLPAKRDGTPLCLLSEFAAEKFAWPKLWKHHGAEKQTERINQLARERDEPWLARYGGIIGLEWFFPKVLETLEEAPHVYDATEVWLEAGDWFVWQLVGADVDRLTRSTCQAGYKAMWHSNDGYPSSDFFGALHPKLADVVETKMPGQMLAPGVSAGNLCDEMVQRFGLKKPVPVSAATIDAHAGVPGAGAADPGAMVMVMGTSSCHMLNATDEQSVPGVAGVVEGGILPGMFGYETGQAAVGDAFDWLRQTVGEENFDQLTEKAATLPPGAEGVLCIDWFNGCRTPLMDGSLSGAFTGLTLGHGAHHMYRALMEASAFGVRWIVEILRENGVPVEQFIATGGLPHHNPLLVQIYADVLGKPISVHPSKQGPALGAAILGVLAAGTEASSFATARDAILAMAGTKPGEPDRQPVVVQPDQEAHNAYSRVYADYRKLGDFLAS
ncbi:MAG: ribulokinase [Planctomycetes bacterium]|nr:ribulokinase [Planctomycetota bacterium]